jgi:hypothetical protein
MSKRPWLRAMAWLGFLGPLFFLTYNFANAAAGRRGRVTSLAFPWERRVPFLGWTILPYWSSDLLYALSLPLCRTRRELDLHGKRLLAIQALSVACFLAFPLRCTFERPPLRGWVGAMFNALLRFDRPFNQAPSLHAGLAAILWMRYRAHTPTPLRVPLAAWFGLTTLAALTTYQHQFIDLPTGLWAGVLTMAALPERRTARPRIREALAYLAGAVALTASAFALRGFGWLLVWPGFALSMVAAAYWTGDAAWLGTRHRALACLLLPYTLAAWINSRLWTRREPGRNEVLDGVWTGRAPSRGDRRGVNSVVALAPELPIRADARVAMLDLVPPSEDQLDEAVRAISALAGRRPTLVCCSLGYSRGPVATAAWLMASGHVANVRDALEMVRRARPQIVVGPEAIQSLERWAKRSTGGAD